MILFFFVFVPQQLFIFSIILFFCLNIENMLSFEEQVLARDLSVVCNVPVKFVELVIECETLPLEMPNEMKVALYKQRIQFLDQLFADDVRFDLTMEFHAQCLALDNDVPIELARLVVKAEAMQSINEEDLLNVRGDRLNFFLKIAAFIQNNPRFRH